MFDQQATISILAILELILSDTYLIKKYFTFTNKRVLEKNVGDKRSLFETENDSTWDLLLEFTRS